jgi:hypothetical protein
LEAACEFTGNCKYEIPLAFKEKVTIRRKAILDYENGDEPTANPENRFGVEYFNVAVN